MTPTNIIIRHLNKDFPEITRSPGPLAFSEEKYINEILSNSGFKNIKVEKVYSLITTNDSPEKNGELLLSIGLGGRLLADANLSKKELSVIRDEMVEISQKRQHPSPAQPQDHGSNRADPPNGPRRPTIQPSADSRRNAEPRSSAAKNKSHPVPYRAPESVWQNARRIGPQ